MQSDIIKILQKTSRKYKISTIEDRKKWKTFGAALNGDNVTTRSVENIPFELTRQCNDAGRRGITLTSKHTDLKPKSETTDLIAKFQQRRKIREISQSNDESKQQAQNKFIPTAITRNRNIGKGIRQNENAVRVSNLSRDARDSDLHDLFGPFGKISRIYVPYDKESRENRGFAIVDFVDKNDALKAIEKLNGWGYDHLILEVAWASSRQPPEEDKNESSV